MALGVPTTNGGWKDMTIVLKAGQNNKSLGFSFAESSANIELLIQHQRTLSTSQSCTKL